MSRIKRLTVSSIFPAAPDEIWQRLARVDTMRYVARPLLMFASAEGGGEEWQAGETMRFRLRILGILPLGFHTVRLDTVDSAAYTMQTRESSRLIPVWNHHIAVAAAEDGRSRYTDSLEIGAGWRTGFVYWFAKLFFRHRHKRWFRLLRQGDRKTA